MKRIHSLVFAICICGAACDKTEPDPFVIVEPCVATIGLKPNPLPQLLVGFSVTLKATVSCPPNVGFSWVVQDTTIAKITFAAADSAVLQARKPGVSSLTATSLADPAAKASLAISVAEQVAK